jgi:hypothetical protein
MITKHLSILIILLLVRFAAAAQGEAPSLAVVNLALPVLAKPAKIGVSTLPVCTPRSYACNTPASLTYIFTGAGNWNIERNWLNEIMPPYELANGYEILITPEGESECILNVLQLILPGAKLTIDNGKRLRVLQDTTVE